jgi:two-component system, OmpR family, KDP operon response regulator KdpE
MTKNNREILIIDDEAQIRKLLDITLKSNGFSVVLTGNSADGLNAAVTENPDLVLLDLGLPDESGHETLKKLREWSAVPLIILSVQSREEDIVRALDNGANDYLIKPFRTGELLARIRTALRKSHPDENNPILKFNNIEIDLINRSVKVGNDIVQLTQTQYSLLVLFLKNDGRVLTHQYILREIWGEEYVNQLQYLRVFVAQLRKRLEQNNSGIVYIATISGIGYRFLAKQSDE